MRSCQQISSMLLALLLGFGVLSTGATPSPAPAPAPAPSPSPEPEIRTQHVQLVEEPQFVVITEDIIPDVENTTQKVIRVNPLDLPPVKDDPTTGNADSSLFNIQSLLPSHRNYVNSNRMRKPRPQKGGELGDSPIIRHLPAHERPLKPHKQKQQQKKHLHFLYNQNGLDGRAVGKSMLVHVAPGAYPVYYAVSKSNGRFGKFPIKDFSNREDFLKYLAKSKLQAIDKAQRFES